MLHAAIVLVTLFSWEHRLDIAEDTTQIVPIDLVTVARETNIRPAERPSEKIRPVPIPQPEQPQLNTAAPSVPEEPLPEQAKSEPVVAPVPPPVMPKPKPQIQPKKAQSLNDFFKQVTASLQKASPKPIDSHAGSGRQTAMTADLRSMMASQIEPCFSMTAFADSPNPDQLAVKVDLFLNRDGSVAGQPQLTAESAAAAARNPVLAAVRDAALRAIHQCAPYKLPPDRYADWQESILRFTPQGLAN